MHVSIIDFKPKGGTGLLEDRALKEGLHMGLTENDCLSMRTL
jgi:hypothetical protein